MDAITNDAITRVILTGAHSTGKSTLLEDVAQLFPKLKKEKEVARQYIKHNNIDLNIFKEPRMHEDAFYDVNLEILKRQLLLDILNSEAKQGIIVYYYL